MLRSRSSLHRRSVRSFAAPLVVASGYSTSFSLTENPISEGGVWQRGAAEGLDWNNPQTNGVGAFGGAFTLGFDDAIAHLKTSQRAYAANQYVQAVVKRTSGYFPPASDHEIELLTRFSISANDAHGYETLFGLNQSQGYIAVVKWLGTLGSYTPVWDPGAGSISPLVDGDTVRVENTGNAIRIYINGVKVGPSGANNTGVGTNDVDLTTSPGGGLTVWGSGQPGIGFWPHDTSQTLTAYGWKSFAAGDL